MYKFAWPQSTNHSYHVSQKRIRRYIEWHPQKDVSTTLIELTLPGKFSAMSPIFTASVPSLVAGDLIIIQMIASMYWMKWWAHGNLMMLFL